MFAFAGERGIPLYALIDEYDNFANTVLAHHGEAAYQQRFTHGGRLLPQLLRHPQGPAPRRGAAGWSACSSPGVSPITLDDVTSGFNVGRNISLRPEFNDLLGFTEDEVRGPAGAVSGSRGVFDQDVDAALDVMREWYNGYRFARQAEGDLYNTDMVLYYLCESVPNGSIPDELIDTNVRIDYGKLRHLLVVGRQLNGNFDLLRHVIGEGRVDAQVQPSFPLERLHERENFLSLLYFFGLLSFRHVSGDTPRLGIPNQTVRRLMYGYLRDAWRDVDVFSVDAYDFSRLVRAMAYEGVWRPALEHLRDAIRRQTGIRDYVDGEKVVHAFLAAHFSLLDVFLIHTEHELNKGYADLYLEPFAARYPGAAFGYVIEVKYLKRRESLDEAAVAEKTREAADQVRRYLTDEDLHRRHPTVRHIGLAVVFHGWEMAACEAAGDGPEHVQGRA